MEMNYNVCDTCGAKDGRAGNLIQKHDSDIAECFNCSQTRETGKIVLDASLQRTDEEIKKTMAIIGQDGKI